MSGPTGDWHRARRRHLRICREDVWGQCPDQPAWHLVPLAGEGYRLKAGHPRFRPETHYGGSRRSVHLSSLRHVGGRLVTRAWPQPADFLLQMALDRDANQELYSHCADYFTPADARRCLGVMTDRFELEASAAGRDVLLRLDLVARLEEADEALAEDDFDYSQISPVPFTFDRAAVSLDGAAVTSAERFVLRVDNGLSPGPNRDGLIAFLAAGQRAVSLELTKLDDGAAANEAIRSGGTISFAATLTHPAGHSLSLELPVLHPEASDEEAPPGELAKSAIRMEAGTDISGDDVSYSVELNS